MLRTLTTAALAATALFALAPSASAQEATQDAVAGWGNWSFAAGVGSDNRSKDASKSDGEAFVWGQAEWSSASGMFYVAPGLETIKSSGGSDLEFEGVFGARPQVAGFDLDLNAAYKHQIDSDPGYDDTAWEFTADVSRSVGPASARVRLQHSPDGTGSTEAWTWAALRLGWDFTDKMTVNAEVGRREQDNSIDYTGGNVGMTYALTRNLELDVRYHATDAPIRTEQYADAIVAGLSVAF